MERERVTKAVQQSQQGRWATWEDVVQRSISWNEIWKMSPYRLAFVIRSIYDQLPSRDNLRRWGLTEDCKCELCGESETLHHVLQALFLSIVICFTYLNRCLNNHSEQVVGQPFA